MWTSLALPLSTHQTVPGHLWGCHRLWGEGFFLCKVQVCWWIHWLERLGERVRTLELRFWNESAAPPHPPGPHRDSPRQPPAQARTAGVRKCWRKVVFNPMYTVLLPVENLKKKKSKMSLKVLPYCAADRSRTHPGRLGCSWSSLQTPQDSGPLRQTEQTTRHWIETVCFTGVKQALTLHHPPISTLCVTDIQISESFQMPLITLKEVTSLLLARGCQSVSQNTILHMQKSCWIYRIIAL